MRWKRCYLDIPIYSKIFYFLNSTTQFKIIRGNGLSANLLVSLYIYPPFVHPTILPSIRTKGKNKALLKNSKSLNYIWFRFWELMNCSTTSEGESIDSGFINKKLATGEWLLVKGKNCIITKTDQILIDSETSKIKLT